MAHEELKPQLQDAILTLRKISQKSFIIENKIRNGP